VAEIIFLFQEFGPMGRDGWGLGGGGGLYFSTGAIYIDAGG